MANKLDLTRPLYMGATAARAGTVVDNIRLAVQQLDTGEGVLYPVLEKHLLENYTPAKSANYNASFVKSYVRDAVNKYGFLSYDNGGHAYAAEAGPVARAKTERAPRVSKAKAEVLSVLEFIRTAGEVAGAEDVRNTNITPADVAQELGKRRNWVDGRVAAGVADGLLSLETENGQELVYLTADGYAAVQGQEADATSAEETETEARETEQV